MSEPRKDDATDDTGAAQAGSAPSTPETAAAPTPETPAATTPGTPATPTPATPTPETPAIAPSSPISAGAPAAAAPEDPVAPSSPTPAATPAPAASPAPKAAGGRKGLLLGVGGLVVVLVLLGLAAFVWPGFLAGPGKPDDTAAAAVASLGSKDPAALDKVSCHDPDGKSLGQLSPEAMQLIQGAKAAGPATLVLDTQAQLPIDLTLGVQGQTQNIPASLVFAVDDGKWCMAGLSMRR